MFLVDKLINALTGQGTQKDKASHIVRQFTPHDTGTLLTFYRDSRVAANVVDLPAKDATKNGVQWSASAEEISKLEAHAKKHKLFLRLMQLIQVARLTGGGAIYIGTGQPATQPMDIEAIGQDGLKFLTLFDKDKVNGVEVIYNPESPYHNSYEYYDVQAGQDTPFRVHASRLARLSGVPLPAVSNVVTTTQGWGDSILDSLIEQCNGIDSTFGNMVQMVFEGKIDVLGIPDLMNNTMGGADSAYNKALFSRLQTFAMAKGMYGLGVKDAAETFETKSPNYTGVADLVTLMLQIFCGLAGPIPMTKLFGMSPAGLNSTGEGDYDNYKDFIRTFQTMELDPQIETLMDVFIRSALGSRPEEIYYEWRELEKPDQKELAEIGDKLSQIMDRINKMNLYPEEVVAELTVNAMTEYGVLPGFESILLSWFEDNKIEPDSEGYAEMIEGLGPDLEEMGVNPLVPGKPAAQPAQGAGQGVAKPKAPVQADAALQDMAPRPLYVSRKVKNAKEILDHYRSQGIEGLYPPAEMHVTIIYSRDAVDWIKMGSSWDEEITVQAGGPRVMALFGNYLVLQFAHSELQWRNRSMQEAGASYDHDEYLPHISIAEGYVPQAGFNVEKDIEPYRGRIVLGPEIFEDVKEDR